MTILDIRSSRQFTGNDVAWIFAFVVGILLSLLTLFWFNMTGYGLEIVLEEVLGLSTILGAYEEAGLLLGFWIGLVRALFQLLMRR